MWSGDARSTADVVVLGAGIIGTAVAADLAVHGVDVLLVDVQQAPGTGSSGRCDGNVLLQTKHDELLVRLTQRSIETYRRWQDDLGPGLHVEQRGSVVVMTDTEQVQAARARVARLNDLGVASDLIGPGELRRLEPHLVEGLPGAIHCHDDAEVYPPGVVTALFTLARRHGVRFLPGTHAEELLVGPGGVRGVRTRTGELHAPYVVNALGAWSGRLTVPEWAPLVPVEPRHGILLVTGECPGLVRHNIREASYLTDRSGHDGGTALVSFAAEPTYRGNLLLGSSRAFTGFGVDVDWTVASQILQRAIGFVPELRHVPVLRGFAGLRPWTPDNLPLVGESTRLPGYVLATAHEGEGIGLAPATAELVACVVLGTEPDDLLAEARRRLGPDRLPGRSVGEAETGAVPPPHPRVGPHQPDVAITLDGSRILVPAAISLAAALAQRGVVGLRRSTPGGAARGVFCGMGSCQDCVMVVDGRHGVRACLTPVHDGMQVVTGG